MQTNSEHKVLWLNSKQTMKLLKLSSCELMHLRQAGKLKFEKRGNSYFYAIESQTTTEE
jgi:hypothetical protein